MIIIIMRGENFVAHLDGLGGTRRAAEHRLRITTLKYYIVADMRPSIYIVHLYIFCWIFCGYILVIRYLKYYVGAAVTLAV
jgi:hypothetical protein